MKGRGHRTPPCSRRSVTEFTAIFGPPPILNDKTGHLQSMENRNQAHFPAAGACLRFPGRARLTLSSGLSCALASAQNTVSPSPSVALTSQDPSLVSNVTSSEASLPITSETAAPSQRVYPWPYLQSYSTHGNQVSPSCLF